MRRRCFRDVAVFGTGLTAVGLGLVLYAKLGNLLAAVVVLALIGLPLGAINTAVSPILVRATPREYLGRVISTISPVQQLATLVSAVGAGWLVSTVWRNFGHRVAGVAFGPIDTVYLTGGAAIALGGIFATLALRPAGQRQENQCQPAPRSAATDEA